MREIQRYFVKTSLKHRKWDGRTRLVRADSFCGAINSNPWEAECDQCVFWCGLAVV